MCHCCTLLPLILDLRWLPNMNATRRWSVARVNSCLESKRDHFLTSCITAVASFSYAGYSSSLLCKVRDKKATGRPRRSSVADTALSEASHYTTKSSSSSIHCNAAFSNSFFNLVTVSRALRGMGYSFPLANERIFSAKQSIHFA